MTTPSHPPQAPPQGPQLSSEHIAQAREAARRMRAALKALFDALPKDQRTAKALGARFGIEGVVARRLVRAAHESDDDLRLLTRLPSAANLRKTHAAATSCAVPTTVTDELLGAIESFESLNATIGGAKASLTKRLRATLGAKD